LAEHTEINLSAEQKLFFDEVDDFNIEVRYPEFKREFYKTCTREFAENYLVKIKETQKWLTSLII